MSDEWGCLFIIIILVGVGFFTIRGLFFSGSAPENTPAPQSTPTLNVFLQSIGTDDSRRMFGPANGGLLHEPDDGYIEWDVLSNLELADFIASAVFVNPYDINLAAWSYGFVFRLQPDNKQYRLIIHSLRSWYLILSSPNEHTEISSGTLPNLDVSADTRTAVTLEVLQGSGVLYINGARVARFDVSGLQNPGRIAIATGLIADSELGGATTFYEDFIVWRASP
jgi:hypothetical protein